MLLGRLFARKCGLEEGGSRSPHKNTPPSSAGYLIAVVESALSLRRFLQKACVGPYGRMKDRTLDCRNTNTHSTASMPMLHGMIFLNKVDSASPVVTAAIAKD